MKTTCVHILKEHIKEVHALAIYKKDDKMFLSSGSNDKTIKLWNITTRKCVGTLNSESSVNAIDTFYRQQLFHSSFGIPTQHNIPFLVCGYVDASIKIWNLSTNTIEATLNGHEQSVSALRVFTVHNCTYLATGSLDNTLRIWNVNDKQEEWKEIKKIKTSSSIFSISAIHDSNKNASCLVSGHKDGNISFWAD